MENVTIEEVLKAFRALSLDEQKQLLSEIVRENASASNPSSKRFEREMQWLKEHRAEYSGQWVALDGDRLISHSQNAQEVFAAAEASGVRLPLVTRVDLQDDLPFGGW
jgi:hypothetical protein